ncbi:chorismate synthase, partial [Varibaculum cambriense]
MLRWMSAGESHGSALVGILEGMPAGVEITTAKVAEYLASRRAGYGRGARQKFEQDRAHLVAGVIRGKTTGAPVALLIENSEWPKWETVMSPDPVDPQALKIDAGKGDQREIARNKPLTRPRPG